MFGKNKEIYKYVVNARGISRPVLNIVAFIGFFIHNWIIGVVFYCLGRVKLGLAYSLSIACLYFTIALTDSTWEDNLSVFLLRGKPYLNIKCFCSCKTKIGCT